MSDENSPVQTPPKPLAQKRKGGKLTLSTVAKKYTP